MATTERTRLTVETAINAPIEKVWTYWTEPAHITQWNFASEDWHSPRAENDLRVGGKFMARMEAKDGSFGFDFGGEYQEVKTHERIVYTMSDGRSVEISFSTDGNTTRVTETFDAESTNPLDMQQQGWQAIMDNFKRHVETHGKMDTLNFDIQINAPVEKVYRTMLDKNTFKEWTAEFSPGSHYQGSWEEGSKILFLGPDENGNLGGMVSRIKENDPPRFVSIEHLGIFHDGREITSGPEVKPWAGALENYSLKEEDGGTRLSVRLDTPPSHNDYFAESWPRALRKLKNICETH